MWSCLASKRHRILPMRMSSATKQSIRSSASVHPIMSSATIRSIRSSASDHPIMSSATIRSIRSSASDHPIRSSAIAVHHSAHVGKGCREGL